VSQSNVDQTQRAAARTEETRTLIRQVRAASRRKYTPEEKIRIVLEGFRPGTFYAWTKEFMEAGKERLTRDSIRDATQQEIESLKRENHDLKELVADLSLEVYRFKKTAIPALENTSVSASRSRRKYFLRWRRSTEVKASCWPNYKFPGAPITAGGPSSATGSWGARARIPRSPGID
jgi:transposase